LDVWFTLIAGSNRAQLLDRVLQSLPPRLGKWLLSRFSEPGVWLAARLAFTRTNAAWAMVGHVLGLGDRHGDNIMIHGLTGALFGSKSICGSTAVHWPLLLGRPGSQGQACLITGLWKGIF
jgi:hypothetical protein